jgi:type IV pilus assembly protein PilM
VLWDFYLLEENIQTSSGMVMNVLLTAVKRDELYATIKIFQDAGLEIELIDVDALAAINALAFFYPERFQSPVAILDIGTEISTLSVSHQGKPRFIRDISFGGLDTLKRLKRKLALSQDQALEQIEVDRAPTPEAAAILKESIGDLVTDLKVSLNYYLDQVPGSEPVKQLFVGGGGGYHPIVTETLKTHLGISVEAMDILSKVELAPDIDAQLIKKNQGLLPVSLGLLIRHP